MVNNNQFYSSILEKNNTYLSEEQFRDKVRTALKKMQMFLSDYEITISLKEVKQKSRIEIKGVADNGKERLLEQEIIEKYGNIDKHIEEYANVQQAIDKAYELMLTYQNELNQVAKVSFENMDIHIYEKLLNIIELNNQYVAKIILIKDLADRYGDSPSFDSRIEQYM